MSAKKKGKSSRNKKVIHTPLVNIGGSSTDFDLVGSSGVTSSPFSSWILLVVRTTTIRVFGVTAVRAMSVSDDRGNER